MEKTRIMIFISKFVFSGVLSSLKRNKIYENGLSLQTDWKLTGVYYHYLPVFKEIGDRLLKFIHHKNKGFDDLQHYSSKRSDQGYYNVDSLSCENILLPKEFIIKLSPFFSACQKNKFQFSK
jgi:hypothetical protein